MQTRHDALAYTPGVAEPCREIARDPSEVFRYTARGNLVAVVSNGTAVLGLGNIGPLAGKPVMEGKAVLFKRFADIDVFDLELLPVHILHQASEVRDVVNLTAIAVADAQELSRRAGGIQNVDPWAPALEAAGRP